MNRWEMEVYAKRTYGHSIGWMCNVINCGHSRPTQKIKGLLRLAEQDRVAPMPATMEYILIDGSAARWEALEAAA